MNPNNEYHDYSTLDAPQHLSHALQYFFSQKRNAYKFALAKKHYKDIKQLDEFISAARLFKIVTGTDLVTKKHILQYRTTQGMRYLVKKEYAQSYQRDLRNARRTNKRDASTPMIDNSQPTSPFVQLMISKLDDSSDDESRPSSQISAALLPPTPVLGTEESKEPPPSTPPVTELHEDSTPSVHSDITKHAEELEKNMESAMADLQDPDSFPRDTDNDAITKLIDDAVKRQMSFMTDRLKHTENQLTILTKKHQSLLDQHNHNQLKLSTLHNEYTRLNRQLNFVSRVAEMSEPRLDTIEKDIHNFSQNIDTKIETQFKTYLEDTNQHTPPSETTIQSIMSKQDKLQRRLTRLKDGTKDLFEQTESDYDLLHDRLQRLETDFQNLQTSNQHNNTKKKLRYKQPSDSDDSSFIELPQPTATTIHTPLTSQRYKDTNYYRGPNMDYLRKNVNITCSTQEQILEFYIKLRLAVSKGGIHIIPIEEITKDKSIAHKMDSMTSDDLQTQSNALFTLLSNETFIPKEFTMAQNCLLGYASNMDGFGALKAMLKLTHPILSRQRPSNIPPILSESTDIHSYEQGLRNYYLLHKLYNETEYSPLDKAKQFLQGVDDDRYSDAVARIQHQLDTVETLGVPLHEDYDIENIASTIINITGEYALTTSKAIVNTMNRGTPHNSQPRFDKKQDNVFPQWKSRPSNFRKSSPRNFAKTQCFACKQFGHAINQCTLLPKVLAIVQFHRRNSEKCEYILKQHIANNTVNSKRTFVRTLMNLDLLPSGDDSDSHLSHDIIVNTLMNIDIDDDELNSRSE